MTPISATLAVTVSLGLQDIHMVIVSLKLLGISNAHGAFLSFADIRQTPDVEDKLYFLRYLTPWY